MSNDPYAARPPEPDYSGGPNYGPIPNPSDVQSKKLAAGLTGILLGGLGVHKFILGYNNAGAIMLAVTIATIIGSFATCGMTAPLAMVMGVIGLVEGIIYLTKSDEEFYQTYMVGKKEWF